MFWVIKILTTAAARRCRTTWPKATGMVGAVVESGSWPSRWSGSSGPAATPRPPTGSWRTRSRSSAPAYRMRCTCSSASRTRAPRCCGPWSSRGLLALVPQRGHAFDPQHLHPATGDLLLGGGVRHLRARHRPGRLHGQRAGPGLSRLRDHVLLHHPDSRRSLVAVRAQPDRRLLVRLRGDPARWAPRSPTTSAGRSRSAASVSAPAASRDRHGRWWPSWSATSPSPATTSSRPRRIADGPPGEPANCPGRSPRRGY